MTTETYELPRLEYGLGDLEPAISTQIMELHYNKHHQTYITNLNNALKSQNSAASNGNLVKNLELIRAINFNAGGHINHTLFWENLIPVSKFQEPQSKTLKLHEAIAKHWGTLQSFKDAFEAMALGIQGSGWTWLVKDTETHNLELLTTKDQDIVPTSKLPIVGLDLWEHAYYLQYFNNKKSYVQGWWSIVNWEIAEQRYNGDNRAIYGNLLGLAVKM